ncbi:AraC family transcriptional regulator [uncultured Nocardioides sp.]|uniref:helix-turn-helix domain-containing protein n=1 Tax=uncultured Nocardioides sp. TaxID=198441 RepID=UPI0025EEF8FE|nr:helix-turn-helix domain-containing protein [uncultured Nocardioides sp.]
MGDRWPVPPALRPHVLGMVGYDLAMPGPGVHVGMPSSSLTFVLPVGEPLDVGWAGVPASRRTRWSTVSGLHTGPAEIHYGHRQTGVQLALTPLGARTLLGLPAGVLAGEIATLDEAVPALSDLPDRLSACDDPSARLAMLEQRLLAVLARSDASVRADVGHALAALTRGTGVQRTADEVGLSRRHLATLVRAECGVSPKELHRIARLERSRSVLVSAARTGRPSLAGVAAACGYADQAHLTREWHALAGCTPTTWLREELPFVQDVAAADPGG